jgi:hypothetical protein
LNLLRDDPHFTFPAHLVPPEHGKPGVFDVRMEAVCPHCNTRWRARPDKGFAIVDG